MAAAIPRSKFLDRYDVLTKLGSGSFSQVFLCKDKETHKSYAVKQLTNRFRSWADVQEIPEVNALMKIPDHDNLIKMFELHFDPYLTKVSIVLDLMSTDLSRLIKGRDSMFPVEVVQSLMQQILMGLDHFHKYHMIHRDLKPENILITPLNNGYHLVLGDCGSVLCTTNRKPPYSEYISTRWYRSPECLLTMGYYGNKMDIWAAACIFYELLFLETLFAGANEKAQIIKIRDTLGLIPPRLLEKYKKLLPGRDKTDTQKNQIRRSNIDATLNGKSMYNATPYTTTLRDLLTDSTAEIMDFMERMLDYDPDTRSTAAGLLQHNYFNTARGANPMTVIDEGHSLKSKLMTDDEPHAIPTFSVPNDHAGSTSGIRILVRVDTSASDGPNPKGSPAVVNPTSVKKASPMVWKTQVKPVMDEQMKAFMSEPGPSTTHPDPKPPLNLKPNPKTDQAKKK